MSDGRRYLWFAPHAGLWPTFRMEHRLANALARKGRMVTMLHCGGLFDSYCPVMSADRLTVESPLSAKREACRDCRHNSRITEEVADYEVRWLETFVDGRIRERVDEAMASIDHASWMDLEVDGLAVGRYSAYLAMLHHKVPDVTATEAAWREYVSDLRNALTVAYAMPQILDQCAPTHAIVYNALYPTNRAFAELAMRRGAQLVGLHAGSFIPARYEVMGIYQHISASQTLVDSPTIRASLDVPCTPVEIAAVGRHLRELVFGNDPWVYSSAPQRTSPQDLRRQLGLRPEAPVVVVLLSSPDETRSSMLVDAEYHRDPERGYSDIAEFITAARDLAAQSPELDVVLRLHPRLMPNKRESVSSPDLEAILASLQDLPTNAHINAPGDGVSLYDLIGIAAAALNQSSSSGLEYLSLGLPVVSYDPVRQNAYPPEFGPCVDRFDPDGLAAAIRGAVTSGRSADHCVRAFRWYATALLRDQLPLSRVWEVEPAVPDMVDTASDTAAVPADKGDGAPGSPGMVARLKELVPVAARERAARAMARRGRAGTIPSAADDDSWSAEWVLRLDATEGRQVVWEPPIIVRGEPDDDGERGSIEAVVNELTAALGFTPGLGFGPVSEPFAS